MAGRSLRTGSRGGPGGAWSGNGDGFARLAVNDHGVGRCVDSMGRYWQAGRIYNLHKLDGLYDAGDEGVFLGGIGLAEFDLDGLCGIDVVVVVGVVLGGGPR